MKKKLSIIISLLLLMIGIVFLLIFLRQTPNDEDTLVIDEAQEIQHINLVAIGDSLTEGVGDGEKNGGYVGLISQKLKKKYNKTTIESFNFGISGERSDQILKRIETDETLRNAIKDANIISVTVGGNDVMKVFQSKLLAITEEDFMQPSEAYQERLERMFHEIRTLNNEASIFVFGIYNPFYVYFPEITELQSVVEHWDLKTEEAIEQEKNVYFMSINHLLSQGDYQEFPAMDEKRRNQLLFEGDNYHPNEIGYEKMAEKLFQEIQKEEKNWK